MIYTVYYSGFAQIVANSEEEAKEGYDLDYFYREENIDRVELSGEIEESEGIFEWQLKF